MPLFGKKKSDSGKLADNNSKSKTSTASPAPGAATSNSSGFHDQYSQHQSFQEDVHSPRNHKGKKKYSNNGDSTSADQYSQQNSADELAQTRPKLVFHCQQAHGSPTASISGFSNVKELYTSIAEAFELEPADVLFCTLNTHKVDMTRLLGGQIGLDDFIFAHIRGRPKEVEIMKTNDALGLTITDNGAGYPFIKRIKDGSIISDIEGIFVGDHIEKINGISTVGLRHFEVAKMLKELPRDASFLLRVIEPMKSGFSNIGGANRSANKKGAGITNGKETLRLRSKGPASVEMPDDVVDVAVDKINARLESYLGINDNELAQTIWEIGCRMKNPVEFSEELQKTELAMFGFSDEFIFEIWGDVGDAKSGRMVKVTQFDEKF